jgi:hypothetical protein
VRTWHRAHGRGRCGGCRKEIPAGEPYVVVATSPMHGQHTFKRCRQCAGVPMPAHVPLPEVVAFKPMALTRFSDGSLPLDFKMASAGREPGSDDE